MSETSEVPAILRGWAAIMRETGLSTPTLRRLTRAGTLPVFFVGKTPTMYRSAYHASQLLLQERALARCAAGEG